MTDESYEKGDHYVLGEPIGDGEVKVCIYEEEEKVVLVLFLGSTKVTPLSMALSKEQTVNLLARLEAALRFLYRDRAESTEKPQ